MNDCIQNFIWELPENYRPVLVLIELEGLKNKEVAEILGISLDTVKISIHRARKKLKKELMESCDSYWVDENGFIPDMKNVPGEFRDMHQD
jgi:RNA polymerase sigma-70 factor (ECF subfamily)